MRWLLCCVILFGATEAPCQELTPAVYSSIERGLIYLAAHQRPDGSWDSQRYPGNTGITSLATLGFLATGNMPDQGIYGDLVRRGIAFVVNAKQTGGLLVASSSHGPMYEHAFSTLLLAEAWGMILMPALEPTLQRAVEVIVQSQNPSGGWRYKPNSRDADLSVTTAQIVALRAAQNAGISVPAGVIERAVQYVKSCATDDGGMTYMPGDIATFARTAMGVLALQISGESDATEVTSGLRYLLRHSGGDNVYPYYGRYYATQAFHQQSGPQWEHWFSRTRAWLLRHQNADGSWDAEIDRIYGTSLAILTLAVPYQYLPIYQR